MRDALAAKGRVVGLALAGLLLGGQLGACATDATTEAVDGGSSGSSGSGGSGNGGSGSFEAMVPTEVRIASYNARNLFNDRIDGESGVLDERESTPSTAVYQAKLRNTARLLSELDADVVVLQEVENTAVLDDLSAQSELGREYPHRYLVAGNDPRGIDIAVLSSIPIERQNSHRNDVFGRLDRPNGPQYRYARDCVEVQFRVAGRPLVVLGVHFKAKSDDDPDKRLAEAQHTRQIADEISAMEPEAAVVIAGDFNDFPGSPPMDAIEGSAPDLYTSAARQLPPADAWTVNSSATGTGVALHDDLVSNPLLTGYYVTNSVNILHDSELEPVLAELSDHAPVVATYLIQPLN